MIVLMRVFQQTDTLYDTFGDDWLLMNEFLNSFCYTAMLVNLSTMYYVHDVLCNYCVYTNIYNIYYIINNHVL